MTEAAKNRLILILVVLSLIFFLVSIKSCSNSYRQKAARDKEMASRLDMEEKISGITRDRQIAEEKLSAKEKELAQEAAARQATQSALDQERAANQGLKDQAQKLAKEKEALEQELKDKSPSAKSTKSKK